MIKLIIFDLDGVLVEARDIHYMALNDALRKMDESYTINEKEHLSSYDGLPTSKKLMKLSKEKGLPLSFHKHVWKEKQKSTELVIPRVVKAEDHRVIAMTLRRLKADGYKIYCASNSIRSSVKLMLLKAGYMEYIDEYFSNEDVKNPKPHSEIYLKCMIHAGVNPEECLIVEDSHIGREAAAKSGASVMGVRGLQDVVLNKIKEEVIRVEEKQTPIKPKWQGGNMKVLIPMAGAGSRFAKAGYTFPKPLIEVNGKPMIQAIVENLNIEAQHIFIVQKEHYEKYSLQYLLNLISPDCEIIQVDGITEGAACTTLLAEKFINNDEPLLLANSDQIVNWNSNEFLYSMQASAVDAGILTFESVHPKWSFAKLGEDGFVSEVAEKKPISNKATVGIYYWAKGSDYVKYAQQMIRKDKRVNNEFYVCPVFNEAIEGKKKIKIFDVEKMWGIGTPEDLEVFLNES
jgi:HAD superfamily hydrolase (TIGR01509 family)|tara:strand:- start:3192 stop:4568 length:1377 start_codon:yes stop_codon:yes gene_type:complete